MIYTQVVPASHLTPACHPPCPPRSWPFPRTTQWPWAVDCSAEGARSASTLVSTRQFATAAGDLHLRMRPEVQVLPGPPPTMTSGNVRRRVRSSLGVAYAGSRTLTWLPFLVVDMLVRYPHSACVPPG